MAPAWHGWVMSRVVVLGGCGGIGTVATRVLVQAGGFDEVVVADVRADDARSLAASVGGGATGMGVDAGSPASLAGAMRGADVVVNCVGPFYRFGPAVLAAAIAEGLDYVDVCDDLDATRAQLELDGAARTAGVCAVVGMGNSPGLANLFARFAADELVDQTVAVDIMHVHGGEPDEGAGVVKHRIHAMVDPVPVYVDGSFREVRLLEHSGSELVEPTNFRVVGTVPVYPYPHPETITLPRHLPGLQRATNRGVVIPLSYFEHTMAVVRAGLAAHPDPDESVIDGWVDEILAERERLLDEAGLHGPRGCLKVVVDGLVDGEAHRYVFSLSSATGGAGEGTGIPVAVGAMLLSEGVISGPGVHPPEAAVPPLALFERALAALGRLDGSGAGAIDIEHHRPDGTVEDLPLPF
jgi:saccharopine dehydrogenase (NAD+, L-lysine-forming)